MMKISTEQAITICSINHVSEHEIFRRGDASQPKWSMTLESQNSRWKPKLSGGRIVISVVFSYIYIIRTILKFPSLQQRKKAFSTCSSHMIVLSISYGSCIFIYIKPSAKEEVNINKGVSLLISSISPMLNPFIYTLRNKQVKQAFDDSLKKIAFLLRK